MPADMEEFLKQLNTLMTAAALWLAAPATLAASEQGDAGDLPASAQDLSGEVVPTLDGSLADGLDQDPLPVCLTGGGSFSATTVGGTSVDTRSFSSTARGSACTPTTTRRARVNPPCPRTRRSPGGRRPIPAGDLALQPRSTEPARSDLSRSAVGRGRHRARLGPGAQRLERAHRAPGAYTIVLTGTTACSADDTTPPAIDLRAPRDGETVARGASVLVDLVQRRRRIQARLVHRTVADGNRSTPARWASGRSPCAPATTPATSRR